jgi:hypothetical protein
LCQNIEFWHKLGVICIIQGTELKAKIKMKRLVLLTAGLLLMVSLIVALVVAGCASPSVPAPGEEVSSCVTCHTNKDLLKQTTTVVEEATSEATSGEG